MTTPILRMEGVQLAIGGVQILRGVDLEIRAGERHVLIGPNGAGKTSLFNVATGQVRPSAGRVLFAGEDVTALAPFRRARLGLARTFQIASLFRELSVWENLLLAGLAPAPYFGRRRERAAQLAGPLEQLLESSGLTAKRHVPVRTLAYGEQRQLEIALGLAMRPSVLLMDEPMAGLSPAERRVLAARIVTLSGTTPVLMVEHNLDDALAIAERITVLYLGEVVASGPADAVRSDPTVQRIYLG